LQWSISQVVLADPPAPTSVTLVNYYATNNLLETGDFFLLINYNIDYSGTYPTVPARALSLSGYSIPPAQPKSPMPYPMFSPRRPPGSPEPTATEKVSSLITLMQPAPPLGTLTTLFKFRQIPRYSAAPFIMTLNYHHRLSVLPAIMPLI